MVSALYPPDLLPLRWTVAQYDRLFASGHLTEDNKVELLAGVILPKLRCDSVHDYVRMQIVKLAVLQGGEEVQVGTKSAIVVGDYSMPEPSMWMSRVGSGGHRDERIRARDVALVVEVSGRSQHRDRELKLPIYAAARIPEFWIVDVKKESLSVLTEPGTIDGKEDYAREVSYGVGEAFEHETLGRVEVGALLR